MQSLPPILITALAYTYSLKYFLVFLGGVIEGPIVMLACGILYKLGFFSIVPLYLCLVFGDLIADVIWYYVGYYFARPVLEKHGKFMSITPERFEKIKELFHRKHEMIMFFSKVTMGFGLAIGVMVVAGAIKIPIKAFVIWNLLGEFVFVATMLLLGYFFGNIYLYVEGSFRWGLIIGLVLLTSLTLWGYAKYIKNRVVQVE